jgi:hypothetical protein
MGTNLCVDGSSKYMEWLAPGSLMPTAPSCPSIGYPQQELAQTLVGHAPKRSKDRADRIL